MHRGPFTIERDPCREGVPQAEPVRERAQRVQSDMSHDLGAAEE